MRTWSARPGDGAGTAGWGVWAGWAALAAGGVLCALGWYGVSGERFAERQLPYLASCTVPGAALIVAGAVLLSGGIGRGTGTGTGAGAEREAPEPSEPPEPLEPVASSTEPPLSVPGGRLAHRPDCPLVDGRPDAVPAPQGAEPCPVCEPDHPAPSSGPPPHGPEPGDHAPPRAGRTP
ncbi:hypothetical protein [Streptomyces daliensis]